jgi:hypothetical protein
MDDPWPVLRGAGVPLRAVTEVAEAATPTVEAVASAALAQWTWRETLAPRERDALLAWLCAWTSHYPTSFNEAFGEAAEAIRAGLHPDDSDASRHIKLRRLALANLAAWMQP